MNKCLFVNNLINKYKMLFINTIVKMLNILRTASSREIIC